MLEWVDGVYLFSYSLSRVLAFIQFFFSSCRKGKDYANAKRDGISLTRRHLPRSLVYHLSSRDRRVINRNSWNTEFSRLQFTTCNTLHFQFREFWPFLPWNYLIRRIEFRRNSVLSHSSFKLLSKLFNDKFHLSLTFPFPAAFTNAQCIHFNAFPTQTRHSTLQFRDIIGTETRFKTF